MMSECCRRPPRLLRQSARRSRRPWRCGTMAHIHPVSSLCLKLEEESFPKPQISRCRKLAGPLQKQSSFSQMVCEPARSCRGLEEAAGGGRSRGVQRVFISETHTPGVHSVSLPVRCCLPPSFFPSAILSFSICFSVSPSVSFCQLSVPSVWFLHDKDLISPPWFLNLQPPLPGKGKRKFIRPGR